MHSHLFLMDEEQRILFDAVSFDNFEYIEKYLNIISETFGLDLDRLSIESQMQERVELKRSTLLYSGIRDMYYCWALCDECRLESMN